MKSQSMPLSQLPFGRRGVVRELRADTGSRRRLLDLGLVVGTPVETVLRSPAGNPMAYEIRGTLIALRNAEAGQIIVDML
ncbi:MAG TPA: FeoA family protein [Bacillota bacterium]|jgi:ferrous iron transport protein A|nr:ferrous iron transport protein A [Bacillota bacterium]HOC06215.1 FeoA family protein [Bacillota bacterium]HPZ22635.1 FeoA family protein [Bacillota bacterium]HQD20369.1 FeoA family protein [Bacillota bacterium]